MCFFFFCIIIKSLYTKGKFFNSFKGALVMLLSKFYLHTYFTKKLIKSCYWVWIEKRHSYTSGPHPFALQQTVFSLTEFGGKGSYSKFFTESTIFTYHYLCSSPVPKAHSIARQPSSCRAKGCEYVYTILTLDLTAWYFSDWICHEIKIVHMAWLVVRYKSMTIRWGSGWECIY